MLENGGIIAFPTETFYGLGVDPSNPEAVERLFLLKERSRGKPILLLVKDRPGLEQIISSVPRLYESLMKKYWPGPLTLIFPARSSVLPVLTAGTGKIGIRISSDKTVEKLFEVWHRPVTATSANKSGCFPAQSPEDVVNIFGDAVDCIVDGGVTPGGSSSTVIDYEDGKLKVLRQGKIEFP